LGVGPVYIEKLVPTDSSIEVDYSIEFSDNIHVNTFVSEVHNFIQ